MDIKALIDPESDPESSKLQLSLRHGRKRKASEISKEPDKNLPEQSLEKKQGLEKWTEAEDALLIKHRVNLMKWDEIAKEVAKEIPGRIPERTPAACRLRYQNYLEKYISWDSEKINKLARVYEQ